MTDSNPNLDKNIGLVPFLKALVGTEPGQIPISVLADDLGYKSENFIRRWVDGTSKVPLNRLPALAEITSHDLADLLTMWIEQEAAPEHREELVKAAESCSPAWEMQLIHFARELYADGPGEWRDGTWLDPEGK